MPQVDRVCLGPFFSRMMFKSFLFSLTYGLNSVKILFGDKPRNKMTTLTPLPDYSVFVARSSTLAGSDPLKEKAKAEEALTSIQPEVEEVLSSISELERALIDLDQRRAELGLPEGFLSQELCSRIHLQEHMTLFAQSMSNQNARLLDEIEEAKGVSPSHKVPVAQVVDLSLLPSPEQFYVEDESSFAGDLNWSALRSLPRLKKNEALPSAYSERATVVDRYEDVMRQIMGTSSSQGLRKHSAKLRIRKSNLESFRAIYLKDLCIDLGFVEGKEYSEKFKYLRYPKEEVERLFSLDVEDKTSFAQLKAFGINLVEQAQKSRQIEVVEVYMHLRLFLEYCQFIDAHYHNCAKLPEDDFENYKSHLKIEIANRLGLSKYFWDSDQDLNYRGQKELEKRIASYRILLPVDLALRVDESTKILVKELHEKSFIEVFLEKPGKINGFTRSKVKDFSPLVEYADIEFEVEPQERLYFEVSAKKSVESTRLQIVDFLRRQTFSLDHVMPVEKNPFFEHKKRTTLYCKEYLAVEKKPLKRCGLNFHELKTAIESTREVLFHEEEIYAGLAGYGSNQVLFRSSEEAGALSEIGYETYLKRIQTIEKEVDLILNDLPIGASSGHLEDKLAAIADFLIQHPFFIEQQIYIEGEGLKQGLDVELKEYRTPPDSVREFFREYTRHCLKGKSDQLRQSLVKAYEAKEKASSTTQKEAVLIRIEEIKGEIEDLKRKTAEFATQIYNVYKLIYDLDDDKSLVSLCAKVQSNLLEGTVDYQSEEEYKQRVQQLKFSANLLAPSLFFELNQFLTSLKVNHLMASFMVGRYVRAKEKKTEEEMQELKREHLGLKARSEKEVKRIRKLQECGVSQKRVEKAQKAFEAKFQHRAKELLERTALLEAKMQFFRRKMKDLSTRFYQAQVFDLRMVDKEHVAALSELGSSTNPYLDMWIQAARMQQAILDYAIPEFQSLRDEKSLSPSSSRVSSFTEAQLRAHDAVEASLEALDTHLDYFNLGLAAQSIPTEFLVPTIFGVEGGHFFNLLSEKQIAELMERVYVKCERRIAKYYQEERDSLTHQVDRDLIEKTIEERELLQRRKEKVQEAIKDLDSKYLFLKKEEALLKEQPNRKAALKELELEIHDFLVLKKKRVCLKNKRELLRQSLENSEIALNDDAAIVLRASLKKIDVQFNQAQEEYEAKLQALGQKGKTLSLWSVFTTDGALQKVHRAIEMSYDDIQQLEVLLQDLSDARGQLLQELSDLEEAIDERVTLIREKVALIEESQEADRERFSQLLIAVRQKALQTSFEIFGLSCPLDVFEGSPYFQLEAEEV